MRPSLWIASLGLLLPGGCTAAYTQGSPQPEVMLNTPLRGAVPVDVSGLPPAPPSAGGLAVPPGLMPSSAPQQPGAGGDYAGTAEVLDSDGGLCGPHAVSGFHVSGDQVHWGGYRGRIDADGSIQIPYGRGWSRSWLTGQFDGPAFNGTLSMGSCSYMMRLARTA